MTLATLASEAYLTAGADIVDTNTPLRYHARAHRGHSAIDRGAAATSTGATGHARVTTAIVESFAWTILVNQSIAQETRAYRSQRLAQAPWCPPCPERKVTGCARRAVLRTAGRQRSCKSTRFLNEVKPQQLPCVVNLDAPRFPTT